MPFRDAHGHIIGLVGISHDITERMRSEESLKRYAAELEAARDVQERNTRELNMALMNWDWLRFAPRPPTCRRASFWPT